MDRSNISTHQDLIIQIQQARASKEAQELALTEKFSEFADSLSPFKVAKLALHELVKDKEVQLDLVQGGLTLGSDFIIENVFHKNNSIQGFLKRTILQQVSSSFIQKNTPQIVTGITQLFSYFTDRAAASNPSSENEEEEEN